MPSVFQGDYREREEFGEKGLIGCMSITQETDFECLPTSLITLSYYGGYEGEIRSMYATNGYIVYDPGVYWSGL